MTRAYHEMTALALGAEIRAGRLDPVELAEHFLERIEAIDTEHSIYVRTTPARALAEAMAARKRAAAGLTRSPLDGVPVSWKDLFDTAGIPTEGGCRLFQGRVPESDATALARATAAGLVCLGKTNLPDLAYSGLGVNPWTGTPANAFSPEGDPRVPGGSSAGAAVSVARGLAAAGIGTDTGGSVRIPASFNGLTGLKTTWGAIPLDGTIPLAGSLDTIGPLTRDVADAGELFAIMAGYPAADLDSCSLEGRRLLRAVHHDDNEIDPGVLAAIDTAVAACRAAGAEVVELRLDAFDAVDEVVARHGNPITLEGWALWGETVDAKPDSVFRPIRDRLAAGREASAFDAETIRNRLPALRRAYLAATAGYDAVIMATVPVPPPPIELVQSDFDAHARFAGLSSLNTRRVNYLGLCALSLPCGLSEGLPVGLMVIGGPSGEGRLLRTSAAIETALRQAA